MCFLHIDAIRQKGLNQQNADETIAKHILFQVNIYYLKEKEETTIVQWENIHGKFSKAQALLKSLRNYAI